MQRRTLCAGILGGVFLPHSLAVSAMPSKSINATGHSYAQAYLVENPARLLFISGQVPADVADRTNRSHLYRYRLQAGHWVEAGGVAAADNEFQVGPVLSPTGDRLLFAQKDGTRSGEIFLLDLAPNPDGSWPPQCR